MPHDYVAEHFEHAGLWVRVVQDTDTSDPRKNFDHVGHMVCWADRYSLGDENTRGHDMAEEIALDLAVTAKPELSELLELEVNLIQAMRETLIWKAIEDHYVILGLGLHDHGNISMYVDSVRDPNVGWIYCTKKRAHEEWGPGDDATEQAKKCLEAEVEEYSQYLTGDVWGYGVFETEEGTWPDDLDSCWGFYGSDYAIGEAKQAAEACAEAREREAQRAALADQMVFNYCAL